MDFHSPYKRLWLTSAIKSNRREFALPATLSKVFGNILHAEVTEISATRLARREKKHEQKHHDECQHRYIVGVDVADSASKAAHIEC